MKSPGQWQESENCEDRESGFPFFVGNPAFAPGAEATRPTAHRYLKEVVFVTGFPKGAPVRPSGSLSSRRSYNDKGDLFCVNSLPRPHHGDVRCGNFPFSRGSLFSCRPSGPRFLPSPPSSLFCLPLFSWIDSFPLDRMVFVLRLFTRGGSGGLSVFSRLPYGCILPL